MANYGVTWGDMKARCRQEITASRLPIADVESIVYSALLSIVSLHNQVGSPVFKRWNGATYLPEPIEIRNMAVAVPFKGFAVPNDADQSLDNPIALLLTASGEAFQHTTLAGLQKAREQNISILLATIDDVEYELTTEADIVLVGEFANKENLYATVGNIVYIYQQVEPIDVKEVIFAYYFVPPLPQSDSEIVRFPSSLLPHLALEFKAQYLARYGQRLDFKSQKILDAYRAGIQLGE